MQWPQLHDGRDSITSDVSKYDEYISLATRAVPTPPPASSGVSGRLTANPKTCVVPTGATSCLTEITFDTTGVSHAELRIETSVVAAATSATATIDWVPSSFLRFDLFSDKGSISASACVLPLGGFTCASTITWTTQGVADARVMIDGGLFAHALSGSQVAPWINGNVARFELIGDGVLIDSALVQGTPAESGAPLCASTIAWDAAGAAEVLVRIEGKTLASGPSGSQVAPWIAESPAVFELWADGVLWRKVTVQGVR